MLRRRLLNGGLAGGIGASAALLAACGAGSSAGKDGGQLTLATGQITIVPFLSAITDEMMGGWDETIVATYLALREPGEPFIAAYRRLGAAPFKEKLYGRR